MCIVPRFARTAGDPKRSLLQGLVASACLIAGELASERAWTASVHLHEPPPGQEQYRTQRYGQEHQQLQVKAQHLLLADFENAD